MSAPSRDVIVIGAGIVGVNIAAMLSENGHRVRVVDPEGVAEMTSRGNAAALAFSDIMPLASPKIMWKAPRWLFDPLGPLSIRPSYLPRLVPWLTRFALSSTPDRVEASIAAQSAMMDLAARETFALAERADIADLIRHDGSLELYESEGEFRASLPGWDRREASGIEFRHVRGGDLADLQPGLAGRFVAGTFVPGWKTVSDPRDYALAVWKHAEKFGAKLERRKVTRLELSGAKPVAVLEDRTELSAERIVIAAGAWSTRILKGTSAARIPLDTERGYNTTLPRGAFDLKRQLIFSGHAFVVTPLENGVRVGGAVEFAGLDAAPNYARSKIMLDKARDFLPGLDPSGGVEWMGFRPSLPDSLPVLSPLRERGDILLAFGNGHLGLTQSAAMGRIVTDLVSEKTPSIDLAPFRADRF
ncbi:FAD-dependent oxidoreductase [Pseudohoeflea suaedae]|uniref:FAD-dependent oxidoreductase n=1 Tax=Pseudohoeflea suaedae TaxID=877384 RepID=A0A4R5PJG7_9HYPH|nr:FAD-dependent oxidoreductase [Pseudohoeflea suaedae]TDH35000.1 FAD-dependent oxidoreductase [Pseudohoeflea suaedae]